MNFPYYQTIIEILDTVFVLLAYLKLRNEYKKNGEENTLNVSRLILGYLIYFLCFNIGVLFPLFGLPIELGIKIMHNFLSTFFVFWGAGYLLKIPASMYFPKIKNILPLFTALYGLTVGLASLWHKEMPVIEKGVIKLNMPDWVVYTNIGTALAIVSVIVLFFLNGALSTSDKYIRRRSLLLATTAFCIGVSTLYWLPNTLIITMVITVALIGYFLLFYGIYYKPKKTT